MFYTLLQQHMSIDFLDDLLVVRAPQLWGNGSISVGPAHASRSIDPGISVFRNPRGPAELVVTAE